MPPKKKIEFDPTPGAPFAAEPGQEFPAGLLVVRGPGWAFGDQDGGEADALGAVDGWSAKTPGNVRVRWPNGKICSYPPDGKTLLVAPADAVARDAEKANLRSGPRAPKLAQGESLSGLVFVRGPDWKHGSIDGNALLVPVKWIGERTEIEVRADNGTIYWVRVGQDGRWDVLLPTEKQLAEWKAKQEAAEKALAARFYRWLRSGNVWTNGFGWFCRPGPFRIPLAQARLGIDASAEKWKLPENGDFEPIQRELSVLFAARCVSHPGSKELSCGPLLSTSANPYAGERWARFLRGALDGPVDGKLPALGSNAPSGREIPAANRLSIPVEATLLLRQRLRRTMRGRATLELRIDEARLRQEWEDEGSDGVRHYLRTRISEEVQRDSYRLYDEPMEQLPEFDELLEERLENWETESVGQIGMDEMVEQLCERFEEEEEGDGDDTGDE